MQRGSPARWSSRCRNRGRSTRRSSTSCSTRRFRGLSTQQGPDISRTCRQLVTAAPTSIANPKVVLHLDLVVKGLEDSVRVIGDSGRLLGELVRELGTLRA